VLQGDLVRVWRDPRAGELHVEGRLGVHTVAAARAALYDALDQSHGDLVLVLRYADVDDATGLGLLVGLHRRAAGTGRRLRLLDVSPRLAAVLRTTGLRSVLSVDRRPASVG
jgi:anti-sigma B factor antagonist